jgi:hypothetical protein
MMNTINTKLHGIFDYTFAFALLVPWIVNFHVTGSDTWLLAALGTLLILYSLLTDYEFGLTKLIPMRAHLFLDLLVGLALLASPFLLNMRHYVFYWPVLIGAAIIATAFLSAYAIPYNITRRDLDITKP